MRKIHYVIITVLLAFVFTLSGCTTKAETATYKICNDKFVGVAQKYTSGNEYIFKSTLIESTDSNTYVVDLSSQTAYNQVIYNQIQNDDFDEETDSMNFGLLKKDNEYQTIVDAVSAYFARYQSQTNEISLEDAKNKGITIPQSVYANLYNQVDRLQAVCKALANKKTKLVTDCANSINQTNNYIQKSDFVNYLQAYQDFIQVVADINRAYQKLHFDYVYYYNSNSYDVLPAGQTQRWVDSAILYCGVYYYIKDMKYSASVQNAFAHGVTQDQSFTNTFCAILENRGDKLIANEDGGDTAIATYKVAAKKLKAIVDDLDNFDTATKKISEYLKKYNLSSVDTERKDFAEIKDYYQFVKMFDQSISNLQNLIVYYLQ